MSLPTPVLRDGPFAPAGRLIVLFDGECGFCRASVVHLRRWDRADRLVPVPLQAAEHGPPLQRAAAAAFRLDDELTVLDEATGDAARGGDAVLTIVDVLPGGRVMRPAWSDPPFLWLARVAYRFVARHRSRLAAFGMDAPAGTVGRDASGQDAVRSDTLGRDAVGQDAVRSDACGPDAVGSEGVSPRSPR